MAKDIPFDFLTSVVRFFYNTDKGGWQPGGFVGALAGLGAAMKITGGGVMAGYEGLSVAAMLLLPLLGAWAGNKGGEAIQAWASHKTEAAASPDLQPQQSVNQTKAPNTELPAQPLQPAPTPNLRSPAGRAP